MLLELVIPLHLAVAVASATLPPVVPAAAAPPAVPVPVGAGASTQGAVAAAATAAPAPRTTSPFGPAVGLARLAAARGGTETVANNMNLNGTVSNNSAVNVVTGSNTIDAGSFANMAGIPMVVQNSGANVLIQNATIVNVQMR